MVLKPGSYKEGGCLSQTFIRSLPNPNYIWLVSLESVHATGTIEPQRPWEYRIRKEAAVPGSVNAQGMTLL